MYIQPQQGTGFALPRYSTPVKTAVPALNQQQRQGFKIVATQALVGAVWDKQDKGVKTVMTQLTRQYESHMRKLLSRQEASSFLLSPKQLMMQEFFGRQISTVLDVIGLPSSLQPTQLNLRPSVALTTGLKVVEPTEPKKLVQVKSPVLGLPIQQLNYQEFKVQALHATPNGITKDLETEPKLMYSLKKTLLKQYPDLLQSGDLRVDF